MFANEKQKFSNETEKKAIKKLTYNKNYTKIYFNHVRFFNTPSL